MAVLILDINLIHDLNLSFQSMPEALQPLECPFGVQTLLIAMGKQPVPVPDLSLPLSGGKREVVLQIWPVSKGFGLMLLGFGGNRSALLSTIDG